ncbi:hypothetical protein D1AOALGA4SA_2053 [Olavius algarvensis Delta 1 endosymbiont]|nr:hypothetical protein D1AOALGA4SA_2053 [Olavius algarvensis Delta 1 endosymbiont]
MLDVGYWVLSADEQFMVLNEFVVKRSQVIESVDRAVLFNPQSAIRNPKSKGWVLMSSLWC